MVVTVELFRGSVTITPANGVALTVPQEIQISAGSREAVIAKVIADDAT